MQAMHGGEYICDFEMGAKVDGIINAVLKSVKSGTWEKRWREVKAMFNNVKSRHCADRLTNDDMPQLGGELTFEQMVSEAALAGQGTEVGG